MTMYAHHPKLGCSVPLFVSLFPPCIRCAFHRDWLNNPRRLFCVFIGLSPEQAPTEATCKLYSPCQLHLSLYMRGLPIVTLSASAASNKPKRRSRRGLDVADAHSSFRARAVLQHGERHWMFACSVVIECPNTLWSCSYMNTHRVST